MNEIISGLKTLNPQTTAIMAAAYLEHALEMLIRAKFHPLPKRDDNERLFNMGPGGVLGTFSAKIKIAYAAGMIRQEIYEALLLINDTRNVFAHSLHLVDFEHELVASDCKRLRDISPALSAAAGLYLGDPLEKPGEIFARIAGLLYHSLRHEVEELYAYLEDDDDEQGRLGFLDD